MVVTIEKELSTFEGKLQSERLRMEGAKTKLAALDKEREVTLLASRVYEDEEAAQRLKTIDTELEQCRREHTDCAVVVSGIERRIATLNSAREKAERREHYEQVLRSLDGAVESKADHELSALVRELKELLDAIEQRDKKIADRLRGYDGALNEVAHDLNFKFANRRRDSISVQLGLNAFGAHDFHRVDIGEAADEQIGKARKALERVSPDLGSRAV